MIEDNKQCEALELAAATFAPSKEDIEAADDVAVQILKESVFPYEEALDSYDPSFPNYSPSKDAHEFFAIARMVAGQDFEVGNSMAQYFMIDLLFGNVTVDMFPYSEEVRDKIELDFDRVAVCCSRGLALALDSEVYTPSGTTTMKDIKVGDELYDRHGKVANVKFKSEIFMKPTYKMTLADGRVMVVCEDHLNILWKRKRGDTRERSDGFVNCKPSGWKEVVMSTKEMYESGISTHRTITKKNPKGRDLKYAIPLMGMSPEYAHKDFPIDAYTTGLILGDGSVDFDTGYTRITSHIQDIPTYEMEIPYELGKMTIKKESPNTRMFGILGMGRLIKEYIGTDRSYTKKVPVALKTGSVAQRLAVLQGLMDTDGTVNKHGGTSFTSVSIQLAEDVQYIVRSLGGSAKVVKRSTPSPWGVAYQVQISINRSIFRLERKRSKQQVRTDKMFIMVESLELVRTVPTQCLTTTSSTESFLTNDFTVTHNSKSTLITNFMLIYIAVKGDLPNAGRQKFWLALGASSKGHARNMAISLRAICEDSKFVSEWFEYTRFTETEAEFCRKGTGSEESRYFLIRFMGIFTPTRGQKNKFNARPDMAVLDDCLPSHSAAYSPTIMETLTTAIHSDLGNALKASGGKIWNIFTPFNYNEPNTSSILNGSFTPLLLPVAKAFKDSDNLQKAEIVSSWKQMHTKDSIYKMWTKAKKSKTLALFMQERMLRLTSAADRLIPDESIQFCDMSAIERNIGAYNIYITTDYTTTSGEKSDFSGIATWAVSNNQDYFLLNLTLRKRGMQEQYDTTLDEAAKWKAKGKHVSIGVEIDGNQQAHVFGLEAAMRERADWYSFSKQKNDPYSIRKGLLSRSTGVNKHERFRVASSTINQGKMWFNLAIKDTPDMQEFVQQIKGTTHKTFTRADDGPDLITMLLVTQKVIFPAETAVSTPGEKKKHVMWGFEDDVTVEPSAYDGY